VNNLREEHEESAYDLMPVNSDCFPNDIDESELQFEKQYEQRI
jgi:hypothetical protein